LQKTLAEAQTANRRFEGGRGGREEGKREEGEEVGRESLESTKSLIAIIYF